MTVAVCTKCGTMKHGALTPCSKCGFNPKENLDKAKVIILTDHFLSKEDLENISDRIQNNEDVEYPEDVVNEYVRVFEENPDIGKPLKIFLLGCLIVGIIIIGVLFYFLNR